MTSKLIKLFLHLVYIEHRVVKTASLISVFYDSSIVLNFCRLNLAGTQAYYEWLGVKRMVVLDLILFVIEVKLD